MTDTPPTDGPLLPSLDWYRRFLASVADLPLSDERTADGDLNRAQLDMLVRAARVTLGQSQGRPDYDAE